MLLGHSRIHSLLIGAVATSISERVIEPWEHHCRAIDQPPHELARVPSQAAFSDQGNVIRPLRRGQQAECNRLVLNLLVSRGLKSSGAAPIRGCQI